MLADARREDRVRRGQFTDALDDLLWREAAVLRQVVADRVGVAPAVEVLPPGGVVAGVALGVLGLDRLDEVGDDLAGVTDDRHVGGAVLADLRRVDVRVHDLGVRGEAVQLAGDPVVEPGPQGDEQVGLLQRGDGGDRTVHTGHSHVQRVAVGEGAERHQCGGDGRSGQLGQHLEFGGGPGLHDAAADIQHGALGLDDELGGLADLLGVRLGDGPVAGQVLGRRPAEGGLRLERVLGDVDQDRSRTAGGGDVEGLGDRVRDVLRLGDQEVVLGDRHRDADDVRFLEGVGADGGGGHLTGDRDDRHRVQVGVGDRRDQVGRAWAARRHADADLAGGLRVAGGRVAGALLVADQHMTDPGGVHHRVVRRKNGAAGNAEYRVGPHLLEGADEGLRARDVLNGGGRRSAVTGARLGMVGPGGLLGHRHSLLEAEGFCECFTTFCVVPVQQKNPSCREASEGSAPVRSAECH
ncbi:hypothetical protein EES39_20180 [Streptomyces sp. ADI92-24]|nr:hypothetical protein EES39_20180 [Streptomyces sp. ADI92-24]